MTLTITLMKKVHFISKGIVLSVLITLTACHNQAKQSPDTKGNNKLQTAEAANKSDSIAQWPTLNIEANQRLSSPTVVEVNSQGLWFASEGMLGYAQLVDNEGRELARGFLSTTEDWMSEKALVFTTNLVFEAPKGSKGRLIIHNNPGEGDGEEAGEKKQFSIPVSF